MAGNGNGERNGERRRWQLTKEKILMYSGLSLIGFIAVGTEAFSWDFHFEFLLAGLALCGVSIAQWGDKK